MIQRSFIQGSDEWIAWRKTRIGGSDAASILGISPYKSMGDLWEEKVKDKKTVITDAMRWGIDHEDEARFEFELKTGFIVWPGCYDSDSIPYMACSLDGWCDTDQVAVELKCPRSIHVHRKSIEKVPEYYMPQLQHNMYVMNIDKIYFFSYFPGQPNGLHVVERDDKYLEELLSQEKAFWYCVENQLIPGYAKKDLLWEKKAKEVMRLKNKVKKDLSKIEVLESELKEESGGVPCYSGKYFYNNSYQVGAVDYKSIKELEGVDLEKYRKESFEKWTLKVLSR